MLWNKKQRLTFPSLEEGKSKGTARTHFVRHLFSRRDVHINPPFLFFKKNVDKEFIGLVMLIVFFPLSLSLCRFYDLHRPVQLLSIQPPRRSWTDEDYSSTSRPDLFRPNGDEQSFHIIYFVLLSFIQHSRHDSRASGYLFSTLSLFSLVLENRNVPGITKTHAAPSPRLSFLVQLLSFLSLPLLLKEWTTRNTSTCPASTAAATALVALSNPSAAAVHNTSVRERENGILTSVFFLYHI